MWAEVLAPSAKLASASRPFSATCKKTVASSIHLDRCQPLAPSAKLASASRPFSATCKKTVASSIHLDRCQPFTCGGRTSSSSLAPSVPASSQARASSLCAFYRRTELGVGCQRSQQRVQKACKKRRGTRASASASFVVFAARYPFLNTAQGSKNIQYRQTPYATSLEKG